MERPYVAEANASPAFDTETWRETIRAFRQPVLIIRFPDRTVLGANMAACRALGYRESELVGQDAAILHTDHGRFLRFGQNGQGFGEVGEPFSSCGWVKRRDGGILASEHLVTPVATSDDSGIHLSFLKLDDCPEWVALYHKMRSLTGREEEILRHTLRGQGAKTIAIELDISYRTVESHRANLLRKLGVRTTTALFSLFTRPELRH